MHLESFKPWLLRCPDLIPRGHVKDHNYVPHLATALDDLKHQICETTPSIQQVKFSLCLTKHYAMKTYWGSGGITPHIL
jgi:hypothetical protein